MTSAKQISVKYITEFCMGQRVGRRQCKNADHKYLEGLKFLKVSEI